MEKYFSIEIANLRKRISDVIIESELPNCICQMVLSGILIEVSALAEQEYQNDLSLQKKSNKKQV